jgi:hypothetical protein
VPELVGAGEIASRFMVSPSAVSHWVSRSQPKAKSPLRPRFPKPVHESKTGKLWSWAEVQKWGRIWQEHHPGSLPGLSSITLEDYGTDTREATGAKVGCNCPGEGVVSLTCPIHA